jgi:asparagine synthase (glutamine-hydrolysing)
MTQRFLAIVSRGEPDSDFGERIASRLLKLQPPLEISITRRTTIATSGVPVRNFPGGAIFGSLFDRHHPQPVEILGDVETGRIVASRGQRLIDRYWGDYIAILEADEFETIIVRAPFGELPCYFLVSGATCAIASDVALLADAQLLRPSLAVGALVRELAWKDLRGPETCLAGVAEVLGGDCLAITRADSGIDTMWSPWNITPSEEQASVDELADRVRSQVVACVNARAASFDRVLLLLSGGLDSSIVAASLARGRIPFDLVTMTTRDPLGDERDYARMMAAALKRPLHEARREVARIDPERSPAARLPRPAGRLFEQDTGQIAAEVAAQSGARALVTGGGGDNVFCSVQSAAPVADRLLTEGPGRGAFETACAVGRVARASVPAVLYAALGRLPARRRRSPAAPDLSFLTDDAREAIGPVPHPWLATPAGARPGQAAHIKLLAVAESFMRGFDPQVELPMIVPLLSQPLVETCLSIPSWKWFSGSTNRAIARQAFSQELPPTIAWRRSKGTPDSFVAEIYERYQPVFREQLLGGLLARERLIDADAVGQAFSRAGVLAPKDYLRLMRLAEVECWARGWAGR